MVERERAASPRARPVMSAEQSRRPPHAFRSRRRQDAKNRQLRRLLRDKVSFDLRLIRSPLAAVARPMHVKSVLTSGGPSSSVEAGTLSMALTAVICENCRHIGVVGANALPRVVSCSSCGDRRVIRKGFPVKSKWTETLIEPARASYAERLRPPDEHARRRGVAG